MTLNYKIHVEGVEVDGHPITTFATNSMIASKSFDLFCERYPFNEVVLTEYSEKVLRVRKAKEKPLLSCPFNHTGTTLNGSSVVLRGGNGKTYCQVCGWRET